MRIGRTIYGVEKRGVWKAVFFVDDRFRDDFKSYTFNLINPRQSVKFSVSRNVYPDDKTM